MRIRDPEKRILGGAGRRNLGTVCMAVFAFAVTGLDNARADYELTRSTVDGGGGTVSSGGSFVLSGTIGHPIACRHPVGRWSLIR